MTQINKYTLSLLLLLTPLLCGAQDPDISRRYIESAGLESLLFRGRQAPEYYFVYNGTPYWSSPQYKPGRVSYDGRLYEGLELNIDACAQKLLCTYPGMNANGVFDTRFVDWAEIGGKRYVTAAGCGSETLPDGYYEVVYDAGKARILKQTAKTLKIDKDGLMRSQTGYDGPIRSNTNYIFVISQSYYHLSPDGTAVQIKKGRDIRKLYPEKKKELGRYMRSMESNGLLDIEVYLDLAMRFVEGQ